MRQIKTFATLLSVALTLSFMGCSPKSGSVPRNPADIQDPNGQRSDDLPAMSWKLTWSAHCANRKPEVCLGAYSFHLFSDGNYQIGPGPNGQTLTGRIKGSELVPFTSAVSSALRTAVPIDPSAEFNCSIDRDHPYLERMEIQSGLLNRSASWTQTNELCTSTLPLDQAERIREQIKILAQQHYPEEFPSPCIDAGLALDQLHVSFRGCQQDSDCSLIDGEYVPLDASLETRELVVDDCSYIPFMVVANAFRVVANQRKLLLSRELARRVCGDHLQRMSCSGGRTLNAESARVVCQQNSCRVIEEAT